jgi:hypothetical protein
MELLKKEVVKLKMVESTVQTDDGNIVIVKDYYDERDKIVDSTLQTKDGYPIDDPAEAEEITDFLDSLDEDENQNTVHLKYVD